MAVIHTSERSTQLSQVLDRCGSLEVINPVQPEPVQPGRLYLAPPNRHLIVKSELAMSWMGPRENRHRPAVDVLFRSAARVYRSRVIAVVLSGALDDGSAGALAVKARGGTVVVEDPASATVCDMPANVLRQVKTDYCLPLTEIPQLLVRLVAKKPPMKRQKPSSSKKQIPPPVVESEPFGFTCPECGGALAEIHSDKTIQVRCHVGHKFPMDSFSEAHADALERALWIAIRKLNEQRGIQEKLARAHSDEPDTKKRYCQNVTAAEHDIRLLEEIIARL
jgi:two-component system, chemotaxis family, protein-glutamate methylesterase/glutaminase